MNIEERNGHIHELRTQIKDLLRSYTENVRGSAGDKFAIISSALGYELCVVAHFCEADRAEFLETCGEIFDDVSDNEPPELTELKEEEKAAGE